MNTTSRIWTLAVLLTMSSQAFATQVTLDNRSGRTLCVAVATSHQESNGAESEITGFNCIQTEHQLALDAFDGAIFVAMVDMSGADYIGTRTATYPPAQAWVPSPTVADFELDIMQFDNGGYSYSYYLGSNDMSRWRTVGDLEDLHTILMARGFHQVHAWILNAGTLGPSALIRLSE